jgi:hypothetical protein
MGERLRGCQVISRGMNYDFILTLAPPLGTSPTLQQTSR